jgi:DNA-binding MarR family transcriptional regulator
MSESEKELEILEHIHQRAESVRQRDLAQIVGLSLGMTNAILKRLAGKGWLIIRKVNNRNIRYAVTPAGIEQITRRSFRYFKRTIKNVVVYKEAIEELVCDIRKRGFESILFIGKSDLDFLVEYACGKHDVVYLTSDPVEDGAVYYLYSEDYIPDDEAPNLRAGGGLDEARSGAPSVGEEEVSNRGFLQEFLV